MNCALFHSLQTWQVENEKMKEKLLSLIGKIGRETKNQKTTQSVSNMAACWTYRVDYKTCYYKSKD